MGGVVGRFRRTLRRASPILLTMSVVACTSLPATELKASVPFVYPSTVGSSLERVAIMATIVNNSPDDLAIDPTEFAVRDAGRRIYPANAAATTADAASVRAAADDLGMAGILPLATIVLRKDDVLSGFIVFDMPQGAQPMELIFRQTDSDIVASLPAAP